MKLAEGICQHGLLKCFL